MSYLKDAKLIKTIAESENYIELSEEACRYVLADTELLLRRLVLETAKNARRFGRTKTRPEDVEIALDGLNLNFLAVGASSTVPNAYQKTDGNLMELDQSPMLIKDRIGEILKLKLLKKHKIDLGFEWLFFGGKLNPRVQKATLRSALESKATRQATAALPTKKPFEEFASYDAFTDKNSRAVYLIKEVSPDVLTKESNNFMAAFRETIEAFFEKIDSSDTSIDFKRFNYSLLISPGHPEEPPQDPDPGAAAALLRQPTPRRLTRTNPSSTASPRRLCCC